MKELKWNLSDLFKNNKKFYIEINKVRNQTLELEKSKNLVLDENNLLELLNKKWNIKELANNILVYGSLKYYKNVNDIECIEMKKTAESLVNEVDAKLIFIDIKIIKLGITKVRKFISKNNKLEKYRLLIENLFRMKSHVQSEEINKEIKENNDSINNHINAFNELTKNIKYEEIEVNGRKIEINSSNFIKYVSARDRETRKQTYLSAYSSFKESSGEFANILNSIFKTRIKNAKLENYNSVSEKALFLENINTKVLKTLIRSVNNNIPLIQKYLKLKIDSLGIDNPHLYDFNVPMDGNLKINFTLEETVNIIKNALKPLGDEYLKVVDLLLDGHIDAEPDENKHQSITFSWNTYSFLNFRGSYVDIKNLVHELGHIVNYYLSKENVPYIYEDSTVFVGETASIVNEILLNRYLYKTASNKEEKIFYLSKEIENYFTSVFKQTLYTEYEDALYNIAKAKDLDSKILSNSYELLIKKYYGENIEYDEVSFVEWTRLGHLYRWSYYPYKYATGLLIASSVVNSLIDEKSLTSEKYLEFLSSGSSKYSLDLLKMIDIDLTKDNIFSKGFKVLKSNIEYLSEILK